MAYIIKITINLVNHIHYFDPFNHSPVPTFAHSFRKLDRLAHLHYIEHICIFIFCVTNNSILIFVTIKY